MVRPAVLLSCRESEISPYDLNISNKGISCDLDKYGVCLANL